MAVVVAAAAAAARRALLSSSAARCSSSSLAAAGNRAAACTEGLLGSSSSTRIAAVPSCSYESSFFNRRQRFSSSSAASTFASSSSSSPKPSPPPLLSAPLVDPSTGQRIPGASFPLPPDVFGLPARPDILHRVVTWQLAKRRQGAGAAKNRAAVSGGGRKPWKQKGTGRARAGSIRSPLWVGGGKAHPPVPRSFETKCNKKVRRLALATALSARAAEGRLLVVKGGGAGAGAGQAPSSSPSSSSSLAPDGKTATLARVLAAMLPAGARPSAVLADGGGSWFEEEGEQVESGEGGGGGGEEERDAALDDDDDAAPPPPPPPSVGPATALRRAASALPLVEVLSPAGLQPLSILRADFLVMTPEAVEAAARRVRAQVKR